MQIVRTVPALVMTLVFAGAATARADVPTPTVEPMAPGGVHAFGANAYSSWVDLPRHGYSEQEFTVSGTARAYGSATPSGPIVQTPQQSAAYRTRMIVRRPTDPRRFNGTVLVEWYNVTAGMDFDPVWIWSHPYLMREGYAQVSVTAQAVGVNALTSVLDPERYAGLSHPGDQFSMDIFSQAVKALRVSASNGTLGPLSAQRVLITGESQSAKRLFDYVDLGVDKRARMADGILLDAGGETTFPHNEPSTPLLHYHGEEQAVPAARSTSPNYRSWWVAGASHIDYWSLRYFQDYLSQAYMANSTSARFDAAGAGTFGEQGGAAVPACTQAPANQFPERYAMDAAVAALDRWVRGGPAPPHSPEFKYKPDTASQPVIGGSYTVDNTVERDTDGNVIGGLRLPPIAVPLARYNGNQCFVVGYSVPFTDAALVARYPSFADYYARLSAAAERSIGEGYLLAEDADDLLTRACSAKGRWPAGTRTVSPCPAPRPPARACKSRRRIVIHLPRRIVAATVTVAGERVRVRGRARHLSATIDLRGLPRRTVVVRIDARTTAGRRVRLTRRYHPCRAAIRS